MGVAEEEVGAHSRQLVEGEQTQLVEPVVNEGRARGLGGEDGHETHHIARKARPQPRGHAMRRAKLARPDLQLVSVRATVHPELPQHRHYRLEVELGSALDEHVTAGHGAHDREAPRLDEVAGDPMRDAPEFHGAGDAQCRRSDPRHVGAHLREEARQFAHVRLAGGVANLRGAASERRGQQGGLRGGDGGFEHVERRRLQALGRLETARFTRPRAKRLEGGVVLVQIPPRREVAAGRAQHRLTLAGQQRPEEQHGTAQPGHEIRPRLGRCDVLGANAQRGGALPRAVRAQLAEQLRHHLDVADPRDILEDALLLGEQAGRDHGQCGILVAAHSNPTIERLAAGHHQGCHSLTLLVAA